MLRYSYGLLTLTILLTVIGITAAMWHMAWWIAVGFVAVTVVSQSLVFGAIAGSGSNTRWRPPPGARKPKKK